MNVAIIVAAGTGSRFASEKAKQFVDLGGKPLILHTLEKFEACAEVDEIVMVLSDDGRSEFDGIEHRATKLRQIVTGGSTRAESVKNGLDAVDPSATVVAVHDGARPLVTVDEISRTINKAAETGAACLVAQVIDTVKETDGEKIVRTIERRNLRRALTPQAFRYDILKRAFDGADLGADVTDECYLVEKLGVEIAIVVGNERNIKVTRAEDLAVAEALLSVGHS